MEMSNPEYLLFESHHPTTTQATAVLLHLQYNAS